MAPRRWPVGSRRCSLIAGLCAVFSLAGCSSTSSSLTDPSPVKCAVSAAISPSTFAASGGTGTANVTAARECSWSASTEAGWIALTGGTTGQGTGVIRYTITPNTLRAARVAGILINGQRAQVQQDGAACDFVLERKTARLAAGGGTDTIAVKTLEGCGWTATTTASWIAVSSSEIAGSGALTFLVSPNSGPTRTATITVAGLPFVVTQDAAGAGPETAPDSQNLPGSPSSPGSSPPSPGPSSAGLPGPGCGYAVVPADTTFGFAGGTTTVSIVTAPACGWEASTQSSWITIVGGAQGAGSREVTLRIAANVSLDGRTGTVLIAGTQITIHQAGVLLSCTYSMSPASSSIGSAGGNQAVTVTSQSGCSWSSSSNVAWMAIVSGASGSGSGVAEVAAAQNFESGARTGTATIAGMTFSLQQDGAPLSPAPPSCSYSINPTEASVPVTGGVLRVQVTTAAGCAWTATSHSAWIAVTSGGAGTGSESVELRVSLSIGLTSRTATVTIAGEALTVTQDGLLFGVMLAPHHEVEVAADEA